jgi:polysaccharide export outer membrane protein
LELDIKQKEQIAMQIKRIPIQFLLLATLVIPTFISNNAAFAQQSSPYLIGATDVLNIYVWKEPDLTRDVTVLPDGKITFPLIGEIQAQGRTVTELKKDIADKLKNYVTAPEVTVVVTEINSRRIYTLGKLNEPGPYPLMPGMTVLQALSTAEGFAEWADEKNIRVIRREGGKEIQYRFNYKDFIAGKNIEQNILLKPNDTIVVP